VVVVSSEEGMLGVCGRWGIWGLGRVRIKRLMCKVGEYSTTDLEIIDTWTGWMKVFVTIP
jgi:hypothetical protein